MRVGIFALHAIVIGTCIVRRILIPIKVWCTCILAIDDLIDETAMMGGAILIGNKLLHLELLSVDALHQAEEAHILSIGIDLDILAAITIDGVGFLLLLIGRMRKVEPKVHRDTIAHLRMVGRHAVEDPVVVLAHTKETHIERIAIVVVEFQRIVRLVEKKRRASSTPYGAIELTRAVDAMIYHPAWDESIAIKACLVVGQFDDREFGHPRRIDSLHDHSVLILLLGHDSQRSQTRGRHPANQNEKHLQKGGFHR